MHSKNWLSDGCVNKSLDNKRNVWITHTCTITERCVKSLRNGIFLGKIGLEDAKVRRMHLFQLSKMA